MSYNPLKSHTGITIHILCYIAQNSKFTNFDNKKIIDLECSGVFKTHVML